MNDQTYPLPEKIKRQYCELYLKKKFQLKGKMSDAVLESDIDRILYQAEMMATVSASYNQSYIVVIVVASVYHRDKKILFHC